MPLSAVGWSLRCHQMSPWKMAWVEMMECCEKSMPAKQKFFEDVSSVPENSLTEEMSGQLREMKTKIKEEREERNPKRERERKG